MTALFPFLIPIVLILLASLKQINEYERGVVYTMGRFSGLIGPGWKFILPIFQSFRKVDIRTKAVDVPKQETITRDNVSCKMNAVIYYKVSDAGKAINEVENVFWAVSQLAQTTMRRVAGEVTLDELLSNREKIAVQILKIIDHTTESWGIDVETVELKDIELPESMVRTMAKQAEAERDQYRAQLSALRGKIESLEQRLGKSAPQIEHPDNFDSLDEWALKHLAGRLILLNRAVRAARKSPFNEPMLVYKCLERLAREYVDARRSGAVVDGLFNDLGVHLERTGDQARLSQWKEEYFVPHRTKSEFLAWHLKRGSDKNEANTLRIYFFYDEDDEQVIVGHLPGHLTNEKT